MIPIGQFLENYLNIYKLNIIVINMDENLSKLKDQILKIEGLKKTER